MTLHRKNAWSKSRTWVCIKIIENLLKPSLLGPNQTASDPVSLRWGLRVCFSNTFPGDAEDARSSGDHTLRTTCWEQCLAHMHKCLKAFIVTIVIIFACLMTLKQPQRKLSCCFLCLTTISQPFQLNLLLIATELLNVSTYLNTKFQVSTLRSILLPPRGP